MAAFAAWRGALLPPRRASRQCSEFAGLLSDTWHLRGTADAPRVRSLPLMRLAFGAPLGLRWAGRLGRAVGFLGRRLQQTLLPLEPRGDVETGEKSIPYFDQSISFFLNRNSQTKHQMMHRGEGSGLPRYLSGMASPTGPSPQRRAARRPMSHSYCGSHESAVTITSTALLSYFVDGGARALRRRLSTSASWAPRLGSALQHQLQLRPEFCHL